MTRSIFLTHKDAPQMDVSAFAPDAALIERATGQYQAVFEDKAKRDAAYRLDAAALRRPLRLDAAMEGDLGTLALGTTYRSKAIIEEVIAPNNSTKLFPTWGEVPPGARDYTVAYERTVGEAVVHRVGNLNVNPVSVGAFEDRFPVVHLWTAYEMEYHDEASQNFQVQNIGLQVATEARKQRSAAKVLAQAMNRMAFFGDTEEGVPGIVNYPRLVKPTEVAVPFDGTGSPADVLAVLARFWNYPRSQSRGAMGPTRIATSERVENYLTMTRFGSVNDTTIGMFFEKAKKLGKGIETAHELRELDGAGSLVDGILMYSDDPESAAIVTVQGITYLPPVLLGYKRIVYAFATIGGGIMRTPGHNVLLRVTAPQS
jgi:hypothetical protein